jgi:hypothetical protein
LILALLAVAMTTAANALAAPETVVASNSKSLAAWECAFLHQTMAANKQA